MLRCGLKPSAFKIKTCQELHCFLQKWRMQLVINSINQTGGETFPGSDWFITQDS